MRRLPILLISLLFTLSSTTLFAQDEPTNFRYRVISTDFEAPQAVLSPDGTQVLLFETLFFARRSGTPSSPILYQWYPVEPLRELDGGTDRVGDAVITPDGVRIITSHANGDVIIWIARTGEIERTIHTTFVAAHQLLITPDGETLLVEVAGEISRYLAYNLEDGNLTRIYAPTFKTAVEYETALDSDQSGRLSDFIIGLTSEGRALITIDLNGNIARTDISTGERRILRENVEENAIPFSIFALTIGRTQLAYYDSSDERIHVLNIEDGLEIAAYDFGNQIVRITLSPDDSQMAWIDREGVIYRIFLEGRVLPEILLNVVQQAAGYGTLQYTADGTSLVVSGLYAPPDENGDDGVPNNAIYIIDLSAS